MLHPIMSSCNPALKPFLFRDKTTCEEGNHSYIRLQIFESSRGFLEHFDPRGSHLPHTSSH